MIALPLPLFPELQTPSLRLRQITHRDADGLFQIFADPDVMNYYELSPFTSVQEANDLVVTENSRYEKGLAIRWAITQLTYDRVIGTCGLVFNHDNHSANLGYELARPYWRHGIMSEALQLVIHFSFRSLKVNRLEALVLKDNIPSVRLLEKLAFQLEGTLRQYALLKGLFQDMECYSLLKVDYDRQP